MVQYTTLETVGTLFQLSPEAVDFIKTMDQSTPNGRYDFGENCYVMISEYDTKAVGDDSLMEVHQKYIDVQIMLLGEELFLTQLVNGLKVSVPYDETKDIAFFAFDAHDDHVIREGNGIVFYPEDAHLPSCAVSAPMHVKKAVVKIRV